MKKSNKWYKTQKNSKKKSRNESNYIMSPHKMDNEASIEL